MRVLFAALVLTVTSALACDPPCNRGSLCAATGAPPDTRVCDGSSYVACNDQTRGKTVSCVNEPKRAVCSPSGWAIEATAATPQDGGS